MRDESRTEVGKLLDGEPKVCKQHFFAIALFDKSIASGINKAICYLCFISKMTQITSSKALALANCYTLINTDFDCS